MGVLRVLLALSVITAHAGPIFGINEVGGVIAVKAFFIISGFYMSLILNEKYVGSLGSYRLFLSNRLLRLFPIYWTMLALTLLVCLGMAINTHGAFWSKLEGWVEYRHQMSVASILFLGFCNLFILGQDVAMFLGLDVHTGQLFFTADFLRTNPRLDTFLLVPQAWTVSLEIMFYCLAPFILRRKQIYILGLILAALAIRFLLKTIGLENDPWNYRFFPSELVFFLFGNVAYRIYKRIEHVKVNRYLPGAAMGIVCLLTIFYGKVAGAFGPLLYFVLFIAALPLIFQYSRNSRIDNMIGELSYPIYLVHMFALLFIGRLTILVHVLGPGATTALVSIVLAIGLNRYIARPIEKIRQGRVHKLSKPALELR